MISRIKATLNPAAIVIDPGPATHLIVTDLAIVEVMGKSIRQWAEALMHFYAF